MLLSSPCAETDRFLLGASNSRSLDLRLAAAEDAVREWLDDGVYIDCVISDACTFDVDVDLNRNKGV